MAATQALLMLKATRSQSVADFYQETIAALRSLGIEVNIWTTPIEVADPIPFEPDYKHHVVYLGWRCLEIALYISLGWRATIEFGVVVDNCPCIAVYLHSISRNVC